MPTYSALDHLQCPRCGASYDPTVLQGLCPADGSPLLAQYDLDRIAIGPGELAGRAPDLWRYHELLPASDPSHVVTLGEGMTPLLTAPRLGAEFRTNRQNRSAADANQTQSSFAAEQPRRHTVTSQSQNNHRRVTLRGEGTDPLGGIARF